jgi:phosphate transport system permease protein
MPIFEEHTLRELIFSSTWAPHHDNFGFWPFIMGSLSVTLISFILSVPICFLAGIYVTQFAHKRFSNIIQPIIDILAGLPSVIYGVWGVLVVVPFISKVVAPFFDMSTPGYCILSGGVVLAIMCIPYMLNMLIEVLNTVPVRYKEASLSMGSTYWEAIKNAVIKKSFPGIIASFGLGITKAFGETIAVMMVVGNMVHVSLNPFDAGYPLPALIANNYGEMMSIPMYDSALMFSALLLLVIILLMNLGFRHIINKSILK